MKLLSRPMSPRSVSWRSACLGAGLAVAACSAPEPPPSVLPPSVLLVIADTLRADKLGCYGNETALTPFLDAFADESVLFEHASSHAPWTLPSTASLLTSLYPQQHGAGGRLGAFTRLDPSVRTLASVLADAGYRTASIVNVAFLGETFGLTAGFQHVDAKYYETNREVRTAEETTDAALAWLGEHADEPFFLLVHYFDAHAVYDPPQPFRRRFAAPEDRENDEFVFGTREQMVRLRMGQLELEPQLIQRAEHLYDGEIAYMDGQIGRLLDGLGGLGLAESTVTVFTSDHGEEFLDHGGFEHGHSLYRELTDVPLIVRQGTRFEPRRVPAPVRHIDVAPTVCELVGLSTPPAFMGTPLTPALEGRAGEGRDALAHGNFWGPPLASLRSGEHKLIVGADGETLELYRWTADSREQHDLAPEAATVAGSLHEQLDARVRALDAGERIDADVPQALRAELQALGYASGDD